MTNVDLAVQFFLQIAVILVICRIVGMVAVNRKWSPGWSPRSFSVPVWRRLFFYNTPLSPSRTTLSEAMPILGTSMSITAFPMTRPDATIGRCAAQPTNPSAALSGNAI